MFVRFYSRQINARMIELGSCLIFYLFDASVSPDIPCEKRSKLATGRTPVRRKVKGNSFVILIHWISWLTSWQKNDDHTLNASLAGLLLPPLSTKVTFWSNSITSTISATKNLEVLPLAARVSTEWQVVNNCMFGAVTFLITTMATITSCTAHVEKFVL